MKVGIVGMGKMGSVHGMKYAQMDDVDLHVLDRDPEKGSEWAEKLGAKAVHSREELFAECDAADICLPTDLHAEAAIQALEAGCHVLCEKPLARTLEEADRMIAAAEKAERILMPAQVVRWFPEHEKAHDLICEGAIGTPASVRMRRGGGAPEGSDSWFQDLSRSGGAMLDVAIHDFDWLLWTIGPAVEVSARSARLGANAKLGIAGDLCLATITHESGCISHVEATWLDQVGFRTKLEVSGSDGLVEFDSRVGSAISQFPRVDRITTDSHDPYYRQSREFVDACRAGSKPPVSAQEGRAALALALAAMESAEKGSPVVLRS